MNTAQSSGTGGHITVRVWRAADQLPAPIELRDALRTIDTHVEKYIGWAHLRKAACKLKTNAGILTHKDL